MPTGGYHGEWGTTPFWTGAHEIHPSPLPMPEGYVGLDEQAAMILDIVPDARFFVRMMDMPPESWYAANPHDVMTDCRGHGYQAPSLASTAYNGELHRFIQTVTGYCEQSSWAERVIGYVIYPLGEGGIALAYAGHLFDHAAVMVEAFRAYLQEIYGSDSALRQAWQDDSVSLATVRVPGDEDFRTRNGEHVLFWPEARQVRRERDYLHLQTRLFRRYLRTILSGVREVAGAGKLCGIDALKGNMLGWMCSPTFTGQGWQEHYSDLLLATGTTGMADILDWPEIDLLATPHDYRYRWVGFGYDPEGIADSVYLHGKIMFIEEDQRSYANNERGLFGSLEPGQEEAVLLRNLASALSKGQQSYPMDVCVGYFEAEPIQQVLEQRIAIEEHFLQRERADVPSVVMLVDDRAGFDTDFSSQYNDLAVIRQRIHGMNHCGVPTRTFLFDDLQRDDLPGCHRLFLLPNCYRYSEAGKRLLTEKLFRNGNVLVFGPGSGITDGETVAADFAMQLLGMDFECYHYAYPRFVTLDGWGHPLLLGCGASDTYGDSYQYGPVLVPVAQDGVTQLGSIALDNGRRRPGLVVKEFGNGAAGNGNPGPRGAGDYAVVFTTAVPLPAHLLRNLATFSGTHVYDYEDDVVYADTGMVAIHAVKPGKRTIYLPRHSTVTDVLSGERLARDAQQIAFTVEKAVTRWFELSAM